MAKQQVSKDGEKVIVKKKGGCGTFLAGFFFAFIFMIALIGGGGAYVYFCVNLQQVESLIGVKLPIEGDLNKKTVKDLIALGLDVKDSYVHLKIGEVETKLGVNLPTQIPGTEIDISYLYADGTTIQYKGETTNIKDIEVLDATHNMNDLLNGVVDVVSNHLTIGEVLDVAQLKQTITDLGYPAFINDIYTVNSSKKTLSELTINEAKNVLPEFYGADNLTVAKLIEATGSKLVPEKDMYNTLRSLKVQKITTNDLLNNVIGEMLNDLIPDLKDFRFTQTEEFNNTPLVSMVDYIQSVYVGDFLTFENAVEEDFFTNTKNQGFKTLKQTFVSVLDEEILNLKVNQILTASQIATTSLTLEQQEMTIPQLLESTHDNLFTLFGSTIVSEVGGYVEELRLELSSTFATSYHDLTWAEKLGLEGTSTALLDISDLTVGEVATSDDLPDTIFNKLGTLGNLIGDTDNSILKLLKDIQLSDLLHNAGDAIDSALRGPTGSPTTLATLLDITSTDGINAIIGDILVGDLLDNPNTAITTQLKGSSLTLGELLGMTSASGLNGIIKNITVGNLFTSPDSIIKDTLASSTLTLGELLEVDTTGTEDLSKHILKNLIVADLFGSDPSVAIERVINGTSLSLVLGAQPTTGVLSLVTNYNTLTVGTLDEINVDFANATLGDLYDKEIITDDMLGSGIDTSSPKWNAIKNSTIVEIIWAEYNAA